MTVRELIAAVDALKPNGYTMAQKTAWVEDLESEIWRDVFLRTEADGDFAAGSERPLLLPDSWRRLYQMYLAAMIDFSNAEYTKYANAMAAHNSAYQAFAAWYSERFAPADRMSYWSRCACAAYNGTTGGLILPRGAAVLMAVCEVKHAFDGAEATLALGTARHPASLLTPEEIEPARIGSYGRRGFYMPQTGDERLCAVCSCDGAAMGMAEFRVLIQPGKE